jgi:hypothetical protein
MPDAPNYIRCIPSGEENRRTVYRIFLGDQQRQAGEVRWHDKASRYVFFSEPHLWLDARGLSMLADFCKDKTNLVHGLVYKS